MARLTVTVAVTLLLFAVAQARFPFDLEKKDVNEGVDTVMLPVSDSKATETNNFLLLPTEKPEPEIDIRTEAEIDSPRFLDLDLVNTEAKLTESESAEGETATDGSSEKEIAESEEGDSGSGADSSVVTVISFRPMNRHSRWLPFQFGRRGRHCHRSHRLGHVFRAEEGRGFSGRDAGHGNDMILSEEGAKFENRPRHVPGRWMRFREGDDMRMRHHRFENPEEMHRDREHHHEHHHDHDHDHHHEHEHENGFMGKILKFLNF